MKLNEAISPKAVHVIDVEGVDRVVVFRTTRMKEYYDAPPRAIMFSKNGKYTYVETNMPKIIQAPELEKHFPLQRAREDRWLKAFYEEEL